MQTVQLVALLLLLPCHFVTSSTTPSTLVYEDRIRQLESVSKQLARQLMLQQLYVDEKARSEGDSGLKQVDYPAFLVSHTLSICSLIFIIIDETYSGYYGNHIMLINTGA